MNSLVLGAGRMGLRHVRGLLRCPAIETVSIYDIRDESLLSAREELASNPDFEKCRFLTSSELEATGSLQVVVVATTANGRPETLTQVIQKQPECVLLEKPLGQNLAEVEQVIQLAESSEAKVFVNLNMRMYSYFRQLKSDFSSLPQLQGLKQITLNTGSVGLGANGIHYLDLVIHLLGAKDCALVFSRVDDDLIPSGRGPQFKDFGGQALLETLGQNGAVNARVLMGFHPKSSVFGGWSFLATYFTSGTQNVNILERSHGAIESFPPVCVCVLCGPVNPGPFYFVPKHR